ncbi:hypothetical protein B0H63DRAFT_218943 [Podospora didyma]|uniref:Protein kinase domain-containing protein n=1 Tax=Podospora didyma TaxID=330526 RepID=A0AAE0KIM5_9PEZI|nr:hypothetical protein B0H63DRAFT_218943 [Podospora didyma]
MADRRTVLLENGTAHYLKSTSDYLLPQPSLSGTIYYLAPERELQKYDLLVDIWAMGIVGSELTYGCKPFEFTRNPWREGEEYEKLRPDFLKKYNEIMAKLANDSALACGNPTKGYIHLGRLIEDSEDDNGFADSPTTLTLQNQPQNMPTPSLSADAPTFQTPPCGK